MSTPRNVGGQVTSKVALTPRAQVAAGSYSLTGASIQKKDAHSALFVVSCGSLVGSPSTQTVDAKLQDSADGSSWADVAVSAANPAVAITQITAADARQFLEVDLTTLREYVRLAFQVAFSGGSTPSIGLASEAVMGGLIHTPPTHS